MRPQKGEATMAKTTAKKTTKKSLSNKSTKALKNVAKKGDADVTKALEDMSTDELVALFNTHSDKKVKRFKDKATAVRRVTKLLKDKGIAIPAKAAKAKASAKSKAPKEPRVTKTSKIRELFATKKSATLQEIMDYCGHDRHNTQSMMAILKNPKRTKDLLVTEYDRETKTYTLVED